MITLALESAEVRQLHSAAMRGDSGENDNEDDNDDKPWFCHINQQSPIAINLLPCNY